MVLNQAPLRLRKTSRYFLKEKSIFKDYVDMNPVDLKKACEKDFEYSKILDIFKNEGHIRRKLEEGVSN